ncbi:hypothetical protein BKK54_03210 [Rodentibacter genomosp. 1]|uniref:HEPN domain-containing protein n=1 Tax=Rodentibacter genomosp. 1 TaxID=1908264 RepID=A0A1V3J7T5_9PAST|nr:hypothetical protein [Rodentibacter genomosp. 1]OOF51433.1 hypothetical protein BKK54_03210 [Rodentibacter genomosp. 1]
MITSQDLLQRGKALAQQEGELAHRESIRILYYAVYHRIKEICLLYGYILPSSNSTSSHDDLIAAVNPDNKLTSAKIVEQKAKRMKKLRKGADYELSRTISQAELKTQLKYAEKCWGELSAMENQKKKASHLKIVK